MSIYLKPLTDLLKDHHHIQALLTYICTLLRSARISAYSTCIPHNPTLMYVRYLAKQQLAEVSSSAGLQQCHFRSDTLRLKIQAILLEIQHLRTKT